MLKIGFANKYFTLWNVVEKKEFEEVDGINIPFDKIYFSFQRNLSMNEEQALKTAVLLGCEDLEVDNDLRGKSSSFSKKKTFPKVDSRTSFVYEFGKYKGKGISPTHDSDHLFFYYEKTRNIHAKKILIDQYGFFEYKKQLIDKKSYFEIKEQRAFLRRISSNKTLIATMTSNLNRNGIGRAEIESKLIFLKFPEVKVIQCKRFEFALPILNKKEEKIVGKNIQFVIKKFDKENSIFEIESFKILKEQVIY